MKAVLPYCPAPSFRSVLEGVDKATVKIVSIDEADIEGLSRELGDAEVLLHVLAPVTAAVMEAGANLRLIQKIGVGIDAIDIKHAESRGIAVCNMPGTNTAAVAEFALALMLACLRRLVPISREVVPRGQWTVSDDLINGSGEIGSRCIGLVGYGAVARRLAIAIRALGGEVIAYDPWVKEADLELVSLEALLARCDIVSLHVPLTPETLHLFGADRIRSMKKGAILINTARGPLVDEAALHEALRSGYLGAAGLDVFQQEPPAAGHPLLALDNVIATPHIAWLTTDTWRRSAAVIVENCRRLQAGEPLLHRVA